MRPSRSHFVRPFGACTAALVVASATVAHAAEETPVQIDLSKDVQRAEAPAEEPPPEAPPPLPYKKTLVLDSSLGARAFLGEFGKTAVPGFWFHTQLGYELLKWFMLFVEGDLSFSDTSGTQKPPRTRAFPIYGLGAGGRFTARFGDRIGVFAQLSIGAMKADIATNALGLIGFRDAEDVNPYAAARVGLEWYQIDRHFALGVNVGIRLAQGFETTRRASDTPLVTDGGLSLRYAF